MTRLTRIYFFNLLVVLCSVSQLAVADPEQENMILKMNRDLENWNLKRLESVQSSPASVLRSFTTDGCSGGLSEAWNGFAKALPEFKRYFGKRPPWESCCVSHDRAYWQGETLNGFDQRLQADQRLRECVSEFGKNNSTRLAKKFKMPASQIETQLRITSELMYHAVRLGGKPCSYLPWRWGYGWPHCAMMKEN